MPWLSTCLYLGNDWWIVFGLTLDIAGVWMLASDVLPEHRLSRHMRILSALDRIAEQAPSGEKRGQDFWGKHVRMLRRAARLADRYNNHPKTVLGHNNVKVVSAPEPFDRELFLSAVSAVRAHLGLAAGALAVRWRWPLPLAAFLVVAGFVMQLWGTIPVT
jgi:hypothetical protein